MNQNCRRLHKYDYSEYDAILWTAKVTASSQIAHASAEYLADLANLRLHAQGMLQLSCCFCALVSPTPRSQAHNNYDFQLLGFPQQTTLFCTTLHSSVTESYRTAAVWASIEPLIACRYGRLLTVMESGMLT